MKNIIIKLTWLISISFAFAIPAFGERLDDYYLKAFSAETAFAPTTVVERELLISNAGTVKSRSGTILKHKLFNDWTRLALPTQQILAKHLALPVLSGTESTYLSANGRFLIHYTTAGADAVQSISWVQTVAQTFEDVASWYQSRNWRLAPTVNNAPYDVYLCSLAPNYYGLTTAKQPVPVSGFVNAYSSYIQIDSSFTNNAYNPMLFSPLQDLQITAVHEYNHAIQYGYNYAFDDWYAEATATWIEGEFDNSIGQAFGFIPYWFDNTGQSLDLDIINSSSITLGAGYSRWLFNKYLTEQYGSNFVLNTWQYLADINSTNGSNIKMLPVLEKIVSSAPINSNLATDFFEIAKRFYQKNLWTAPNTSSSDVAKIYSSPVTFFANYTDYPVNYINNPSTSVTLPHYSFAYYKFLPSNSASTPFIINVTKDNGTSTTVFKKISGTITEVTPDQSGISYTINDFGSANPNTDEVVLLVANISDSDNLKASFSVATGVVQTAVPVNMVANKTSAGAKSGGGCFIATAAYGSYLHPQVQVLRNFRDSYLLTNAPGRLFVSTYYYLSPPLADFISKHDLLRAITRFLLTPLIVSVIHPIIFISILALSLIFYLSVNRKYATIMAKYIRK